MKPHKHTVQAFVPTPRRRLTDENDTYEESITELETRLRNEGLSKHLGDENKGFEILNMISETSYQLGTPLGRPRKSIGCEINNDSA
jgi:hypothetical protein